MLVGGGAWTASGRASSENPHGSIVTPPQAPGPPGLPSDGSSDHPAFSQDDRDVRLLAFDSSADNLVRGDTNAHRDVFVLHKTRGMGRRGGKLELISVSTRGEQANGDSTNPSVDGTTGWSPRCVAFESTATNLVPHGGAPGSGVYVRNLATRSTLLVSARRVSAEHPSIDGRCRYVAFQSGVLVLVRDLHAHRTLRVARGAEPDLQTDGAGIAYARGGQVYYQALRFSRWGLRKRGAERLVSAARGGAAGNGISGGPSVDDHGHYVAFESTATNLCVDICQLPYHPPPNWRKLDPGDTPAGRDANGSISDIYRANLQVATGAAGSMSLISYDYGYNQLDGPSTDPQISRAGHEVTFQSSATNGPGMSVFGPDLGATNIFSSYSSGIHQDGGHLHLESYGGPAGPGIRPVFFNGASANPAMSSRGNYFAYATSETGYGGESNGVGIQDILLVFVGPEIESTG
jgi:hypothetical protein